MRTTRHLILTFLASCALSVACGCERRPEERSSNTATPAPHSEQAAASADDRPLAARARCVLTLPVDPPPHQKPSATCPKDEKGPLALPHGWVSFPDSKSAPRVAVELAEDEPSRERGLMYRTSMPEDQGMVFSWPDASERAFWMHDTCIPLDMLYVGADSVIAGILEEVPPMNDASRGVPCPVTHVIELNAGWARAHGVSPGQRVVIEK